MPARWGADMPRTNEARVCVSAAVRDDTAGGAGVSARFDVTRTAAAAVSNQSSVGRASRLGRVAKEDVTSPAPQGEKSSPMTANAKRVRQLSAPDRPRYEQSARLERFLARGGFGTDNPQGGDLGG